MNLHETMRKAYRVGVFGSDSDHCSDKAKEIGYKVGKLLAEKGAIVFTGGGAGVMEEAARGATDIGGLVISISPGSTAKEAHAVSSIIIPSGIGFARGQILTNTVDGAILVEGGLGTHQEAAFMYWLKKPTVAIASSGGTAEVLAGKQMDKRNLPPILKADSAEEAVNLLFEKLKN